MKIKSLLIGSAAASMLAVSGAQAADPIIYAEPEPLEYVRVCDVYGAGFFYIPGTETCLRIGGYMRYQMNYNANNNIPGADHSFSKLARLAPYWDARTENAYGTLRGYGELELDWTNPAGTGAIVNGVPNGQDLRLHQLFIEQTVGGGTLRIGKSDTPYARFLGFGAGGVYGATYGYRNNGEVSYTYSNAGLSFIVAATENASAQFEPNFEVGANYAQSWGSIGAIAGYDGLTENFGAKGVLRVNFAPVSLGLHVFYSEGPGSYAIGNPGGGVSEWSVLAHARASVTETVAVKGHFQWFDDTAVSASAWQAVGGLVVTPVPGFDILPEVLYTSRTSTGTGDSNWTAALRFQRSF